MNEQTGCPRCGYAADEAGWCGVCGNDLVPDATYPRMSRVAQERSHLWADDPASAIVAYADRADISTTPTPAAAPVEDTPDPEHKTCPQCAEEIKFAAKVCRYCGHNFDVPASNTTLQTTPTAPSAANPLAVTVTLVGAAVLAVALLLPYATVPASLTSIKDNTVLKHNEWQYLVGALLAPASLYWSWQRGKATNRRVLWIGAVALAWSIYDLADSSARTYGLLGSDGTLLPGTDVIVAGPGAGLYVATLGSALLIAGGCLLAWPRLARQA